MDSSNQIFFDVEGDETGELLPPPISYEVKSLPLQLDQVRRRGKDDFNFFSGLCIPDVMEFAWPVYYIALWQQLVAAIEEHNADRARKILRYVVGLPRGFCKTTFIKCLVAWLICYDKVSFVLIICATDPLSESFMRDLDNILHSDNIKKVYGIWDPALDQVATKIGSFRGRKLILKARGSGAAVRGMNEDNKRPDFIICDDMQTKENDNSETDREALIDWFVGTLLKVVAQKSSIVVYVGNMYSDQCILYKLKINPHWVSLITGCILDDGSSLWPDLWSILDLFESFVHDESLGKADIWFAEMMNDPIESLDGLIHGAFPSINVVNLAPPDASFVTLDPAGYRNSSDDHVATAHHIIEGKGYIVEMDGGIWTPKDAVEKTITMALRNESSLIGVESVAYQGSLVFWFEHYMKLDNIQGINVVAVKRATNKTKTQEIRNFIKEIYDKNYAFVRDADRARFVWQAAAYRISRKKNKDDWLDSPAMGVSIRNEFSHLLTIRRQELQRQQEARVRSNNTPF